MRRVLVESPFAGRGPNQPDVEADAHRNWTYVRAVCKYLSYGGDAPYASHIFFTEFLNDKIPHEREIGINAGLHWGVCAQATVVAIDRGISGGMRYGIERARREGRAVEWLSLKEYAGLWLPPGVERDGWRGLVFSGDAVHCD